METVEELVSLLTEVTSPGYRERLVSRGLSRSMIWRNGRLPSGSPVYARSLTADLLDYGFSLLRMALSLRRQNGDQVIAQRAFETAAESLEAVIRNGAEDDQERGFLRTCAASAYHLGSYSARAYSLMAGHVEGENLSPCEKTLALLMLRRLDDLREYIRRWLAIDVHTDEGICRRLHETPDESLRVAFPAACGEHEG